MKTFFSVNWIKTSYINLRMLPLKDAVKLPIIIYGKCRLSLRHGKIIFETPVKTGILKIGQDIEIVHIANKVSEITINGTFCITGSNCGTGKGVSIIVLRNAFLQMGANSYCGQNTKIICTNRIIIGKYLRLGFESQIYDSNFHFVKDLLTNEIKQFIGSIHIYDYCWVGNRSSITKGSVLPKKIIIGSNSLCNKDYTKVIKENSLIAGIPARLIKENMVRIFDFEKEIEIHKYFKETGSSVYYDENE